MPRHFMRSVGALALAVSLPLSACSSPDTAETSASSAPAEQTTATDSPEPSTAPPVAGSEIQTDAEPGGASPEAGAFKLVSSAIAEDWQTSCATLSEPDIAELESYGGDTCEAVLAEVKQEGNLPIPEAFSDAKALTYTTTYHGDTKAVVVISDGDQRIETQWLLNGERWFGGYLR